MAMTVGTAAAWNNGEPALAADSMVLCQTLLNGIVLCSGTNTLRATVVLLPVPARPSTSQFISMSRSDIGMSAAMISTLPSAWISRAGKTSQCACRHPVLNAHEPLKR